MGVFEAICGVLAMGVAWLAFFLFKGPVNVRQAFEGRPALWTLAQPSPDPVLGLLDCLLANDTTRPMVLFPASLGAKPLALVIGRFGEFPPASPTAIAHFRCISIKHNESIRAPMRAHVLQIELLENV
jgi:hypothetical protein